MTAAVHSWAALPTTAPEALCGSGLSFSAAKNDAAPANDQGDTPRSDQHDHTAPIHARCDACSRFGLAYVGQRCPVSGCVGRFVSPDHEGGLPSPTRFRAMEIEVADLRACVTRLQRGER